MDEGQYLSSVPTEGGVVMTPFSLPSIRANDILRADDAVNPFISDRTSILPEQRTT
jgi:hypothetical protein